MTGKKLEATDNLKRISEGYYKDFLAANRSGIKTAWLTSQVPAELFYLFDVFPFFPENYAALCAARHLSENLCHQAEINGFTMDLCSYARTVLGSVYSGEGPFGPLPEPDLLVACNNQCATVLTWWKSLARYFGVPCIIIDTPPIEKDPEIYKVDYVREQLEELLLALEQLSGNDFEEYKLAETISNSNRSQALWSKILNSRKCVPSPINANDIFTHMFAAVALGGKKEAVNHYEILHDEVRERERKGIGVIRGGEIRLHWDNIPIWYDLKLFDFFADRGAVFVSDTYSQAWLFEEIRLENYLDSFAKRLLKNLMNISMDARNDFLLSLCREYDVDGVVMHSNRSCKLYSAGHPAGKKQLSKSSGIPCLIIEGDMNDPRFYSRTGVENAIEVFLEMIAAQKNGYRKNG